MTTKAQQKRDDMAAAMSHLREDFPKGSTVVTVLTSVSASGMSRTFKVLTIAHNAYDNAPVITDVSYLVARALDWRLDRTGRGVKVQGTGMDMAFHLVYTLASVLYDGDGYALRQRSV